MHPRIGVSTKVYGGRQHDISFIVNHVAKHAKIIEVWTEFPAAKSFDVLMDERMEKQVEEALASTDLIATVHAPIHELNLASPHDKVRHFALDETKKAIEFARRIDAKIVTTHGGKKRGGFSRKESLMLLIDSLNKLGKVARDNGVVLSMENNAFGSPTHGYGNDLCIWPEELLFVMERIREPVKVTLDLAHLETIPHINYEEYIYTLKNWIAHCHVADVKDKQHIYLPIGSGTVRFDEAFEHLRKIGYKGFFIIEGWINAYQDKFLDLEIKNLEDLLKRHFEVIG